MDTYLRKHLLFGTRNASDEVTFSATFYPNFFGTLLPFIRDLIGRELDHLQKS